MFSFIDALLNKITMYRLVLYYLVTLLVLAIVFGLFGFLSVDPANLSFSTLIILAVCWIVNTAFAKGFRAATNIESVYITALILALIISPVAYTNAAGIGFIIFASAWAMASKFILAVHKKHLFNPAAFGIAFGALILGQGATWWVGGNLLLLPFVFLGGLLIVRKIRRFDLVWSFFIMALITIAATTTPGSMPLASLTQTLLHSPLFFLAFVMLTEPLTLPPTRLGRIFYGAIVGVLFAPNLHIGSFYFTPELALLVGNLFVYFISPEGRFTLTLARKHPLASGVHEFVFAPDARFTFRPGQYVEWTLPHRLSDNRGNRRFFTIASSPTEEEIRLGVKFYEPKSSFKQALDVLEEHTIVSVAQLAGDFTLPKNPHKKLAFIAGGIGITPFRSMVKYLIDTDEARSVVLLYANKTVSEIAYAELFDEAEQKIGMKTTYAVTGERISSPGIYSGRVDEKLIAAEIPDYADRLFFISGPPGMVAATRRILLSMRISRFRIKTDYFPGF